MLKGSDQDQGGVQGVQCPGLNNVMQISDYDMLRSMMEHDDEVQGDQIKMHESI